MIDTILSCITKDLNDHLKNTFHIQEDLVVLSGLVNPDGTVAVPGENKIVVTLINLLDQKGIVSKSYYSEEIFIMVSASFSAANYLQSLKSLSLTIDYLKKKSEFNQTNTPSLDASIKKIVLYRFETSFEQLQSIWQILGANYQPSVVYKISCVVN